MEQIREHYEIEKELANRLKNASKKERMSLYCEVYSEILKRVPSHPHNTDNEAKKSKALSDEVRLLKSFLSKNHIFLEFGKGGYCQLCFEMARYFRKVYAIYPICFSEIPPKDRHPENFKLINPDELNRDIPLGSIHIVFSNNLIEHLHPEDMMEQLQDIYNVLVPKGKYICATPHRFKGPDDISQYFDVEATCFHLKEYTNNELYRIFKKTGFSKIQYMLRLKGIHVRIPIYPSIIIEYLLNPIPYKMRRIVARTFPFRHLLSICLIATK